MRSVRAQRGVSLFETLIYVSLLTAVTVSIVSGVARKAVTNDYRIAENDARIVVARADLFRQEVIGSVAPAVIGDPWIYDFAEFVNFTSAQVLATTTGDTMPLRTPWGAIYEVRADDRIAVVRYTIPADLAPGNRTPPAGGRITLLADGSGVMELTSLKRPVSYVNHRNIRIRTGSYGEESRS